MRRHPWLRRWATCCVVSLVPPLVVGVSGPRLQAQDEPGRVPAARAKEVTPEILLRSTLARTQAEPGRTYDVGDSPVLELALRIGQEVEHPKGVIPEVALGPPEVQADAALRRGLQVLVGTTPPENLLDQAARQNEKARQILKADPLAGQKPLLQAAPGALRAQPGAVPEPTAPYFDWRYVGAVTEVQNQNPCGCCWAFATVAAFESSYAIRNNWRIKGSEQQVLSCNPFGYDCGGGWWAFDFFVAPKPGITNESQFPFQGVKVACPGALSAMYQTTTWGYVSSANAIPTPDQIKQALCTYGPLAIAVNASPNFLKYRSGVFNGRDLVTDQGKPVNHAVTLIGWDERDGKHAWTIKNSWGPKWGQGGFMAIEYGSNNIGFGAAWVQAAAGPTGNPVGAAGPEVQPAGRDAARPAPAPDDVPRVISPGPGAPR